MRNRSTGAGLRLRPVLIGVAAVLTIAAIVLSQVRDNQPSGTDGPSGPFFAPSALRVLAGSELEDVQPLLKKLERDTGVRLDLELTGTLEGAELIARGDRKPAMAWYASSRYLEALTRGGANEPIQSRPTMRSPVVVGVKRSVARKFGWDGDADVTWRDIADKAGAGEFRFGMTNPQASNSGFSALVGVASAFGSAGDAPSSSGFAIDREALRGFFTGQKLRAGSSGFLAGAYVRDQEQLDGLVNYESVLLGLNAGTQLREPLELVYPREGVVTADYPLVLTDPAHRSDWEKVIDWLRSEEIQRELMERTSRRPVVPKVPLDRRFPTRRFVEVALPGSRKAIDDLLFAYLDEIRPPTHTIFALDVSGSMAKDGRLDELKTALRNLTGADTSTTGRFARFRLRERVTVIPFESNVDVRDERDFRIGVRDSGARALSRIRDYADRLRAGGGTALFSAMRRAYVVAARDRGRDSRLVTSIVVMSDGKQNGGIGVDDFLSSIPESVRDVRTFAIRFGEADAEELKRIADETGGKVFEAREGDLAAAFKEIREFQ